MTHAFLRSLRSLPVFFLALAFSAFAEEAKQSALIPAASQPAMEQIVASVAQRLAKAGCNAADCSVLVMDFYTAQDSTSLLGVNLADQFSERLSKALHKGKIVDRSVLREYMNRNRIAAKFLKEDEAAKWLGRELGATTVVQGDFEPISGSMDAKFKIFDSRPKKKKVELFQANFPSLSYLQSDLQDADPFPAFPRNQKGQEAVPATAITADMTRPSCPYMPNPSFTDEARSVKFSGTFEVNAVVTKEGTVEPRTIIHGLPYGLNGEARKTISTWRCKPALKNGHPVPVLLMFEVTFRMF
jgi:hypothetical protein